VRACLCTTLIMTQVIKPVNSDMLYHVFFMTNYFKFHTIQCATQKSGRSNFHTEKPTSNFQKIGNYNYNENIKQAYLHTSVSRRGAAAVIRGHYLVTINAMSNQFVIKITHTLSVYIVCQVMFLIHYLIQTKIVLLFKIKKKM